MKWTKKKPTKPGFYWYQERGCFKNIMTQIFKDIHSKLICMIMGSRLGDLLKNIPDGKWAGPIPEPDSND